MKFTRNFARITTPASFRCLAIFAVGHALVLLAGCLSVKAPERIDIGGSRPPPVDSGRIPDTRTHEEARAELTKAYQNIQYLERENTDLSRKASEYKRERDECRDQRERAEDD